MIKIIQQFSCKYRYVACPVYKAKFFPEIVYNGFHIRQIYEEGKEGFLQRRRISAVPSCKKGEYSFEFLPRLLHHHTRKVPQTIPEEGIRAVRMKNRLIEIINIHILYPLEQIGSKQIFRS